MLQERIRTYLSAKLAVDGDLQISNLQRIPGGASRETWSFDAEWTIDGERRNQGFVIRRDPDASLLVTERDVEYRVMDAVATQGIPVPGMRWLETESTSLERPFFVMDRIDGCETNPQKVLLDPRFFQARARIADEFVSILAQIHAVDWLSMGLDFLGVPSGEGGCAAMEIERWESVIDRDSLEPQPVLRAALQWLKAHPPAPAQKIVLVHADYRTGNFLCSSDGEIKGILDWEMTHLGDPMEDVGWATIRPWRWLGDEKIGGLMDRADFYQKYADATGLRVDEEAVRFWEVLGNLKLAAIFLTGARSFCDGRTRSVMMAFLGRNIGRLELEIMDLMGV